jgi:hypothetical protein
MVKIKVSYTTTVDEVIEVDDKFYALTEPGGWNELSYKEQNTLTNELLEEIVNRTDVDCQHSIICVEEDGTEELMYEG